MSNSVSSTDLGSCAGRNEVPVGDPVCYSWSLLCPHLNEAGYTLSSNIHGTGYWDSYSEDKQEHETVGSLIHCCFLRQVPPNGRLDIKHEKLFFS